MIRPDLKGLVVCGGASSRMGTDKSNIRYYEQPQRYHIADMLRSFCGEAVLSLNREQHNGKGVQYPALTDLEQYSNTGPAAALLTAAHYFPESSFITIGCDYPFLTREELTFFSDSLREQTVARAFYNREASCYEPLLAYYSAAALQQLKHLAAEDHYSLQQLLRQLDAEKHDPLHPGTIRSVDTPEQATAARKEIGALTGKASPHSGN